MNRQQVEKYYRAQGYSAEEAEDEALMTATHEAGHFVMAAMVGGMLRNVNIVPTADRMGFCGGLPFPAIEDQSREEIQALGSMRRVYEAGACANMMHLLAGDCAVGWADGDCGGATGDWDRHLRPPQRFPPTRKR